MVANRESPGFVEAGEFLGADPAADVPALNESPSAVDELDESYRFRKGPGPGGYGLNLFSSVTGRPGSSPSAMSSWKSISSSPIGSPLVVG
jgi:hypothetical protein